MSSSSGNISQQGWMWKLGGSVQSWKRRYMVLRGRAIFYYKSDKDKDVSGAAQGEISLDGSSVTALLDNNEYSSSTGAHNRYLFGITPSQSTRMYLIQASSDTERDSWMNACVAAGCFRITQTAYSCKTQSDSFLEGWIDRKNQGLFGGSVERFFAALFHDKLALWKNTQTSSQPAEHLLLSNESILKGDANSSNPIELISKKGEPKWHLIADTPSQKAEWLDAIGKVIAGKKYEHVPYAASQRGSIIGGSTSNLSVHSSAPSISIASSAPSSVASAASPTSASSGPPPLPTDANASTKIKRQVNSAESDDEDDVPPPPPASVPGADDDSDVEDDGSRAAVAAMLAAKNDDISLAEDEVPLDFEVPPPPARGDDDESPPPPPSPFPGSAGDSTSAVSSPSKSTGKNELWMKQPDVALQLRALLADKFASNPQLLQQYLNSFMQDALTAAVAPSPAPSQTDSTSPLSEVGQVDLPASTGTRRMTSKLTKMLMSTSALGASDLPRMLHVHLLEARSLPAMDSNGFSDPYCVLSVRTGGKKGESGTPIKSKTISATLDPVWDQQMTLDVPARGEELVLDVYDHDQFSTDDFIGRAVLNLSMLKKHAAGWSGWISLAGIKEDWETVGSIFISVVMDEHFLDEKSRHGNQAFLTTRAQALMLQEMKHFQSLGLGSNYCISDPAPVVSKNMLELDKLKVFIATMNVGNAPPPDDLSAFLPLYTADVYVIGTQECDYGPRRDNKSCKVDWQCCLVRHFGRDYTLIKYHSLWEIRIAVFVLNRHLPYITNVHAYQEATGIGNVLGNKGGAVICMQYASLKLCFVNSHLAAHQNMCDTRNQNYRNIVKNIKVGQSGASDLLNEYHHVIWMGDLNYRLDYPGLNDLKSPPEPIFNDMVAKINKQEFAHLFTYDQLSREMKNGRVFIGFKEGNYNFPPTFKVKRNGRLDYTQQRSPAWCDRILIRSVTGYSAVQTHLGMVESMDTSDHKPVTSSFEFVIPATPPPIDRTLGETIIRIHDVRCTGLRAPKDKVETDPSVIANAKDVDPHLVFLASFLPKPVVTPVVKKSVSPQWLELPPSPSTYNDIRRIRHTLVHVRVMNHQSQDAIIGRAIISLTDLQLADIDPSQTPPPQQKGKPLTKRFEAEITYGGMPAGTITGQITVLFKEKQKK